MGKEAEIRAARSEFVLIAPDSENGKFKIGKVLASSEVENEELMHLIQLACFDGATVWMPANRLRKISNKMGATHFAACLAADRLNRAVTRQGASIARAFYWRVAGLAVGSVAFVILYGIRTESLLTMATVV